MSDVFRILAIDGGGIRGILPAVILAEIEKRTGKPIHEMFDLIAGTSTGGLISLGLTKPREDGTARYTAMDLIDIYVNHGDKIFSRSFRHMILSAGSLLDEKYPSDGIEKTLESYFGNTTLTEALTEVLITSYEIERNRPWFFKSRRARTDESLNFMMKHAARATSAAPTYFEPFRLETGKNEYLSLVDGGVYANNPAMCAFAEAKVMFAERRQAAERDRAGERSVINEEIITPRDDDNKNFLMVSLGTGKQGEIFSYEKAKDWGLAGWVQPVLYIMFQGNSDTVDFQLRQLLPPTTDGRRRYYRFEANLKPECKDMDDASTSNLKKLRYTAEELIRDRSDEIQGLCDYLVELSD
jgi:predicted acylesterase/phospholipase RssA